MNILILIGARMIILGIIQCQPKPIFIKIHVMKNVQRIYQFHTTKIQMYISA